MDTKHKLYNMASLRPRSALGKRAEEVPRDRMRAAQKVPREGPRVPRLPLQNKVQEQVAASFDGHDHVGS